MQVRVERLELSVLFVVLHAVTRVGNFSSPFLSLFPTETSHTFNILCDAGSASQQQQSSRASHVRYRELFPVQSLVWSELAGGTSTAHDLCVAAPTGSGKTLAYALPIVNGLAK